MVVFMNHVVYMRLSGNTTHQMERGDPDNDIDVSSETFALIGKNANHLYQNIVALAANSPRRGDQGITQALPRILQCPLSLPGMQDPSLPSYGEIVVRIHERVSLAKNQPFIPTDVLKETIGVLHPILHADGLKYRHCLCIPLDYTSSPLKPGLYGMGNTTAL